METNQSVPQGARKWGMLVVLSLALAIIIIDTTLLNVSLAAIIKDFNTDIQSIQWVITAYSLTLAALTITGGRLGDFFGRKRMFMLGAVLFAIGSFFASISQNVGQMIIGESIIEGFGAALMMPATASLLVANFHGRERGIAFGVWGGIAAASAAIGPIVGGALTTYLSWRWGFRINIGVVLLLLIGSRLIPSSHDLEKRPQLDWLGVILSATGLLSLVYGFIESSKYGWLHAKEIFMVFGHPLEFHGYSITPVAIALGLVILMLFLAWEWSVEQEGRTPLVSLGLFTNAQFSAGTLTTMLLALGQTGLIFSLPIFLQSVRHLDAFHTGLSLLPMSLTLLVVAPLSAFLAKYIRPKILIVMGLTVNALAFLLLRSEISVSATSWSLAPGLILFGIGMGAAMAQLSNLTLSAVPIQQSGEASGVNNTLRQLGSTLGSAILGAVLLTALASNLTTGIQSSNVIPSALKATVVEAANNQTSSVEFGTGVRLGSQIPESIQKEIISLGDRATTNANKEALLLGALFAFLGALVAFIFIPNVQDVEKAATVNSGH